jgi:hypothetical protein
MRKGNEIVQALPDDVAVARSYPTTHEKGEIVGGKRLTILTKKNHYQVSEEVRVIHVLEIVEPGHELLIMGPKPVYGEYVDDRPVTPQRPDVQEYDGLWWRVQTLIMTRTSPLTDSPSRVTTGFTGNWANYAPIQSN